MNTMSTVETWDEQKNKMPASCGKQTRVDRTRSAFGNLEGEKIPHCAQTQWTAMKLAEQGRRR